jgi:hypothetical protein
MEKAGNQATSVAKSIGGCMSRDTGSHTEDVLKYFHPTPLDPLHPADATYLRLHRPLLEG